ncbi:hypothetical protein TWF706_005247 [Orbilia oligospora]|uniref:Rhodanese domain-containing protein n=1 Tax=Orbilia oligospora TaxID=2813651 RepID=A0A7C8JUK9_ORBOL|nr:hypothetical protein TWF706_005247 [Orbilia oligospora]KAF3143780.1 hypothetical protein TWF703_010186 [Orbilia oligospora]
MEHIEGFDTRQEVEELARTFAQNVQLNPAQQNQPSLPNIELQVVPNPQSQIDQQNLRDFGQGRGNQQGTFSIDLGEYQGYPGNQGYRTINQQGNIPPNSQARTPLLNLTPLEQAFVNDINDGNNNQRRLPQRQGTNSPEERKGSYDAGNGQDPWYSYPSGNRMQTSLFTPSNQNPTQNQDMSTASQVQRLQQRLQVNSAPANNIFSEEDFDFESQDERASGPTPDTDEKQLTQGAPLTGNRNSKVSALPLTSKKLSEHNLTRNLMSSGGVQFYVRRSDNSIQPLRDLDYVERATATDVGFGASMALAAWSRFGGAMGAVRPEDLYAYITRPGIRPTDYLIVDTRAEGGTTRLSNVEQAIDRVHVIPYSSDKCMFTSDEFVSLREGEAASDKECDMIAPEIARTVANSRAKFIIVHCAQGRNRSPVVAMALHANLRRTAPDKKVLLLVGGSDSFWAFVRNPQAQQEYFQRKANERTARQRTPEQLALQREQILRENPNVIELPSSPEFPQQQQQQRQQPGRAGTLSTMPGTNVMIESIISPTWDQLTIQGARRQAEFSNLPLEELDRGATIDRDAEAFLKFYGPKPEDCIDESCKPINRGPYNGGPPGPGGGMGGGGMGGGGMGGGFSGGMGGGMGGNLLTKRSMDPLDIAGGRLRKRSFGIFMPEPTGRGIRVIHRR